MLNIASIVFSASSCFIVLHYCSTLNQYITVAIHQTTYVQPGIVSIGVGVDIIE